jgi:GNAT superfamily N-acetyltransferase
MESGKSIDKPSRQQHGPFGSKVSRRELLLAGGGATAVLALGGVPAAVGKLVAHKPSDVFNPSRAELAEITRRLSTVFPARVVPDPNFGRAMVHWYDGDRVIGLMSLGPIDGDALIVGSLSIDEAYRNRGIMTAAIEESRDWLRARGIEELRAPVTLKETRKIFARRGFRSTGDGEALDLSRRPATVS